MLGLLVIAVAPAVALFLFFYLRDKYLNDARLLLKYGRDCGAMLMMCSLMDAASGLYTGRTNGGRVGDSFREFIIKYMPQFGNIRFGDTLCKDKKVPVRDPLEALRVFVWGICDRSWRSRVAAASWSVPSGVGIPRPAARTLAAG